MAVRFVGSSILVKSLPKSDTPGDPDGGRPSKDENASRSEWGFYGGRVPNSKPGNIRNAPVPEQSPEQLAEIHYLPNTAATSDVESFDELAAATGTDFESEPGFEAGSDAGSEFEAEPEPGPDAGSEFEAEPEPELERHLDPEPDSEPELERHLDPEPDSEPAFGRASGDFDGQGDDVNDPWKSEIALAKAEMDWLRSNPVVPGKRTRSPAGILALRRSPSGRSGKGIVHRRKYQGQIRRYRHSLRHDQRKRAHQRARRKWRIWKHNMKRRWGI